MSSRQSIAARQRLTKTSGRTPVSTRVVMVRVEWTTSPVVRIQARREFNLQVNYVTITHAHEDSYSVGASVNMTVQENRVLTLVACENLAGWYYIVSVVAGELRCSCPMHGSCKHIRLAEAFYARAEQIRREALGEYFAPEYSTVRRGNFLYKIYRLSKADKWHYCMEHGKVCREYKKAC